MRIRIVIVAGLAGAAAAYLLDPTSGSSRRNRLRAWVATLTSSRAISSDERAPLPENLAPAPASRPVDVPKERGTETPPITEAPDDAAIERAVLRKLEERPDLQTGGLLIDVVRGVAYLRGDLRDRRGFNDIVELTSTVPGVRRVQSLLHLPESETISSRPATKHLGDAWNG